MKNIFFLLLLVSPALAFGQTVNYTASSDVLNNPERGLQKYSITGSNYATTNGANNLSVTTLNGWKNSADKVTVVFRYFLLSDFMNSDINAIYLNNIQTDFDNIRTAGFKAIVRFSYSNAEGTTPQQPSKAQILTHIAQLSPILFANRDVIFSHQAGFIGTWGEWYYTNSSEFGNEDAISPTQWANRKDVVDAMLSATPAEIPLQVRYVGIKTTMYGATPLTAGTAYQNTANARVGFYNDAFLNNWGDQGTYSTDECTNPVGTAQYNYLSNETQYLPMSGETNGLNPCSGGFRTTGANAIYEMGLTNWTTLNRDYHPDFWGQINTNDYAEILKKLGYRFVLNSSTITSNGTSFDLNLNLTNVGFARVFKERPVYLVLKNTATNAISTYPINTDIRSWETAVSINQNINPGLTGTFKLYLWMPDNEPSLQSSTGYSIQLANTGTWETATGYNDLLQTVTLSAAAPVELITFSARPVNSVIELKWFTASEQGNDRFVIERSADSKTWTAIGSVDGAGTSIQVKNYQFTDLMPLSGLQFYRLRQIDLNGEVNLSKIVSVSRLLKSATLHIYPNPTLDWVTIDMPDFQTGNAINVFVVDINGKLVYTQVIELHDTPRTDLSMLLPGQYIIYCNSGHELFATPVIKSAF